MYPQVNSLITKGEYSKLSRLRKIIIRNSDALGLSEDKKKNKVHDCLTHRSRRLINYRDRLRVAAPTAAA